MKCENLWNTFNTQICKERISELDADSFFDYEENDDWVELLNDTLDFDYADINEDNDYYV
jgi:hypothetical protein